MQKRKLGIAVVGLGGAVGTTMVAGIELLKQGLIGTEGLPLAESRAELAAYDEIVFAGWDLFSADLAEAAEGHEVLSHKQFVAAEPALRQVRPWRSVANNSFLSNIEGDNIFEASDHAKAVEQIRKDLRNFRERCEKVVMINLASTEKLSTEESEGLKTVEEFERAISDNSAKISPAMTYAYAAIKEGVPYGNFTPSVSVDLPALTELAEKENVPVAGKDGKTGQTFVKTVLAPALRSRALKVEGWYSTNILGNRDGLALSNEDSLRSKVKTKHSVLRNILGYEVEDHIVDIRYYKPRGDNKEAWDNIDVAGFLGQPMQIKVNFLCRDSVLAAPLAIEIARCLDLASRRGKGGVQEQLSVFFKSPMTKNGDPEQAFHKQEALLDAWLSETGKRP
ncbi:MAG: inositol-3-phosphate synthase [Acidobacteria bacterium]|nr:MAG: inositol-3-phosphate synthase [Acidobacteriota bacterium]REK03915.1 MAG: inositol-3-phosphate synthase [Acidobacteriota bacterium]REK15077.1 MAG: inositol-3-phosphate synthase [Acidobacteriota bacterium]REK46167.1 MAG: inositol-3-phosphate synthase [Acidobacteriota bacterium]